MAEHKLTLKATLDSKEVQAELNKLRQMQQSVLGNNGNGTSANGNTSLQNLNSTIGRLNSSIGNLQKSIERMNSQMKSQQTKGNNGNNVNPPVPTQSFDQMFGGSDARKFIKTIAYGMVIDQLGDAIKTQLSQVGTDSARKQAHGISILQGTANYAIMGGMAGGPWGAAIGAAIGAGKSVYEAASEERQFKEAERKSDLEKFFAAMNSHDKRRSIYKKLKDQQEWQDKMDMYGQPMSYAQREARIGMTMNSAQYRFEADKYNSDLQNLQILKEVEQENLKEQMDLMAKFTDPNGKFSDEAELVDVQKRIQKLQNILKDDGIAGSGYKLGISNQSSTYGMTPTLEKVPSRQKEIRELRDLIMQQQTLEKNIASFDDATSKVTDARNKIAQIEQKIASLQEQRLQNLERASELDKQEAEKKKQLVKNADSLMKGYKQYAENRENSGDTLSDPKQRYNYYIGQAQDLEKQYKDTVFQATFAATADEAKSLLEKASELKKEWDFNNSQASIFGNREIQNLQDKLSMLKAPDMSQVNSLSKYGYMINKSDDQERLKMANEYQKQQVDLTRQIRDRVQEMDTGSKFQ